MSFNVGENVGPYRVIEQLGQGGMATVYKAYHAALDRYVALKVLHPAFGEDPNFAARFQREARLVAKLDHPNLLLFLPFTRIASVDQPMAYIAEGRFNLLRGDNAKAREFLERARQSKPALPEVTLLDAEISFKEGNKEQAHRLLNELMSNPDTPEWIRILADQLLSQNP